jgi:hypothetical protein
MSRTADTRSFIENYFDALNDKRPARIPIAAHGRYSGSMPAGTIRGADAVREHIVAAAPFIDRFEIRRMVVDGAVFFEVEDGQLAGLDNLFDTPLMFNG